MVSHIANSNPMGPHHALFRSISLCITVLQMDETMDGREVFHTQESFATDCRIFGSNGSWSSG